MECRVLMIMVHSATDLKEPNLVGKMNPYVSISLSGDPNSEIKKTEVDADGGKSPIWKGKPIMFVINQDLAKSSNMTLVFKIMAEKSFGDKEVGGVYVPVKDLLEDATMGEKSLSYSDKTPSGKAKGTLNLSYKLSGKFTVDKTAAAHGYPLYGAPQPGYGYWGYPPAPGYGGHEKNEMGGGKGLGIGAGLIGDVASDAGDIALLDDGADFDF